MGEFPMTDEEITAGVLAFQKMNANVGIEMTLKEATTNYAACMTAIVMLEREKNITIDEVIDRLQEFVHEEFHPGVCKKFLTEAKPFLPPKENETPETDG